MKISLSIYFVCFLRFVNSSTTDPIVDYYVNLINSETARATTYPLPRDSSAFRTISDSLVDFGAFDYVIVGAGSAGSVIANRLSAIPENQILLIEAGGLESDFSDIPSMMHNLQGLEYNWNYNSTKQKWACLGAVNKKCGYPRGKGLGGTSIINGLLYVRGNKIDYDRWYKQGNPGWSYEEVLPYFIKSEDSNILGDEGYHGTGGYLNVEHHLPYSPQFGAFLAANEELGRHFIDYNGKQQVGYAPAQFNTINGRRQSTGKAFLAPIIDRPNLTILANSLVTKILIHDLTKQAHGVLFSHNGQQLIVEARKEVIISAGAIGSPQLLMLSGIGPRFHLMRHGIPVIQSLAVGNNFHDHAVFFGLHFETSYSAPINILEQNVMEYLHGYGQLANADNVQGLAFLQTVLSKIPEYPDIELILVVSNNTNSFTQRFLHLTNVSFNSLFNRVEPTRSFTLYLALLHPKSRGTIRLKSSDPYKYPLIDPKFLSDATGKDIQTLYHGIELALELVNTDAFKAINATLIKSVNPACWKHKYLSRKYWYCQLRQYTSSLFHPVGSCKMGPNPYKGAVVNHELKVYGIGNLRVADASIVPEITSGHLSAAAIMIGEKVSDMIINDDRYHF